MRGLVIILFATELWLGRGRGRNHYSVAMAGEGGYQVTADVQYPDEISRGVAAIDGIGDAKNLNQLDVKFTDPTNTLLAAYANVESGQSRQDKYLQLHYDIAQQQLLGWLDIGGAIATDYYLKGQPGTQLTLFHLDAGGNELTLDKNQGGLTILIPEKK